MSNNKTGAESKVYIAYNNLYKRYNGEAGSTFPTDLQAFFAKVNYGTNRGKLITFKEVITLVRAIVSHIKSPSQALGFVHYVYTKVDWLFTPVDKAHERHRDFQEGQLNARDVLMTQLMREFRPFLMDMDELKHNDKVRLLRVTQSFFRKFAKAFNTRESQVWFIDEMVTRASNFAEAMRTCRVEYIASFFKWWGSKTIQHFTEVKVGGLTEFPIDLVHSTTCNNSRKNYFTRALARGIEARRRFQEDLPIMSAVFLPLTLKMLMVLQVPNQLIVESAEGASNGEFTIMSMTMRYSHEMAQEMLDEIKKMITFPPIEVTRECVRMGITTCQG